MADHLKRRRLDLHLFQEDVARIIGVCIDSVTYWENGRTVPQIQHMPRIIEFLGYNPNPVDSESLAGRIKEYRLRQGLSHKAFGRLIGVDASTVGSWELERFKPNKRIQSKLLRILSNL